MEIKEALIQNLGELSLPIEYEYILTEKEESDAIRNAIESVRSHKIWKWKQMKCFGEDQILTKLASIDFNLEIDREEILRKCNSNKHRVIEEKEFREKEKKEKVEEYSKMLELYNYKYTYQLMLWNSKNKYGKNLILHKDNTLLIKVLCLLLSKDKRYEEECGFSFKKGLLIRGVSGLGKTFLVKCVENHALNPILILSTIEINEQIKEVGEYEVEMGLNKFVYLDDVGTEEATVNHFGTKVSFFKSFIEKIYLRSNNFGNLIASTNMNFDQIGKYYGFRVESRMREIFNVIDISGKDMRK